MCTTFKSSLSALVAFSLCSSDSWAGHPSQGLWVGEVALNAVNQATGAVGNSNTYEFEDPETVTPTSDTAYLRLIVHVNGAGQASLLKSVAIVENGVLPDGTQDIVLLTDPNLYSNYPGIAQRIATAFFDFGDQQAVTAVQELIDNSTDQAVTQALANIPQAAIEATILTSLGVLIDNADVDTAYLDRGTGAMSFLTDSFFTLANVQAIADEVASQMHAGTMSSADFAYDPSAGSYEPFAVDPLGGDFAALVAIAEALRGDSFYGDTRGIESIVGVVVAAADAVHATDGGADLPTKKASARLAAEGARHNAADVTQAYNRFLSGSVFSTLPAGMLDVAVETALTAQGRGDTGAEIVDAVEVALLAEAPVAESYAQATTILSASLWGDARARMAVDILFNTAAKSAAAQVIISQVEPTLREVVRDALATAYDSVEAGPVFASGPSSEYTDFVTGAGFQATAETAAQTAAAEAVFQKGAGVTDRDDLKFLTKRAVSKALLSARNQAAVLPQSSIPLSGELEVGGELEGVIYLPALAPTNPFLHRQHPDHTEGFPITRQISMTVAAPGPEDSGRSGYGVTRLSGTYLEELFGLHKPLGSGQNVGLKTQGRFTLNRLSFADSLNF